MRTPSLEEELAEFLNVMTIGHRFGGRISVFLPLQRLYAMRSAYWIRTLTMPSGAGWTLGPHPNTQDGTMPPPFEELYAAYRRVLEAYRSGNQTELAGALGDLRVIEFCPNVSGQMEMMELLNTQEAAHVRLILHVELALFAYEMGDEIRARHHTLQAWALDPAGWERYILCTLSGIFAISSGRVEEAKHWLADSASACFEDENVLLECGLLPPNLCLARRLLSLGHGIPVVDYLLACRDIWHLTNMPFVEWIREIESGQEPDFEASEIIREMNRPFHRLEFQSRRALNPRSSTTPNDSNSNHKSREEVLRAREARLANGRRILDKIREAKKPGP